MHDPTGLAFRRDGTPARDASGVDEDELARRVSAGDEEAFAELCRRRASRMHALCRGILHNPEDAHDAVQSATEKALAALRRGQLRGDVRPWLTCICRNEALSLLRVRAPWSELDDHRAASGPSPEATVLLRERLAGLAGDLAELPERQRRAIVLREVAELPYEHVASRLGMRADAARQAVREARVALREGDEGRDAACDGVRLLLADGDGRRRRSRRVRSHLRICDACRTWDDTRGTTRPVALRAFLPGLWAALPGAWSWLPGLPSFLVPGAAAGGAGVGVGVGATLVGGAQATAVTLALALGPTALPVPGAEVRGVDRSARAVSGDAARADPAASAGSVGTGVGHAAAGRVGVVGGGLVAFGRVGLVGGGPAADARGAGGTSGGPPGPGQVDVGAGRALAAARSADGGRPGAQIVAGTGRSPVTSGDDAAGRDARPRSPGGRQGAENASTAQGSPAAGGAAVRGAAGGPGGGAVRDGRSAAPGPTASADRRGTAAGAGRDTGAGSGTGASGTTAADGSGRTAGRGGSSGTTARGGSGGSAGSAPRGSGMSGSGVSTSAGPGSGSGSAALDDGGSTVGSRSAGAGGSRSVAGARSAGSGGSGSAGSATTSGARSGTAGSSRSTTTSGGGSGRAATSATGDGTTRSDGTAASAAEDRAAPVSG